MANIRTSKEYKRMMVLVSKACGTNRSDRLSLATVLLGRPVTSFTDLSREDIEELTYCLEAWEKTQRVRFGVGTLAIESMMVVDMLNLNIPYLTDRDDNSNISTQTSRKGYLDMKKVSAEDIKARYSSFDLDSLDDVIDSATGKLDDTIIADPEINSGRWPKEKIVPAPTLGLGLRLGTGGFPRGKVVHLYGAKHSGKSQLAYQIGRMSQAQGIPVILIDTEAALDADFADGLGLDTSSEGKLFKHIMPGNVEELSNLLIELTAQPFTVIVDSIASTASKVELTRDRSKKEGRVGGNAKAWADTLAVIRTRLYQNGGTLILINQVRANMNAGMFGDPEKPWGSEAIQHQVDISFKVAPVKEKRDAIKNAGYKISKLYMKKNRFDDMTDVTIELPFKPGNPYNSAIDIVRSCGIPISVGSSITFGELADNSFVAGFATEDGVELKKKNNKYSLRVDPLLLKALVIDDPDMADEFGINPDDEWSPPEDGNFFAIDIPDVDQENSEYFTIPGIASEVVAIKWMAKHPTAIKVLEQRLLNGLNNKKEALKSSDFYL